MNWNVMVSSRNRKHVSRNAMMIKAMVNISHETLESKLKQDLELKAKDHDSMEARQDSCKFV